MVGASQSSSAAEQRSAGQHSQAGEQPSSSAAGGAGSSGVVGEKGAAQIPVHFACPISMELMQDPVMVATGHTYDRSSITRWLAQGNKTCPLTSLRLRHFELTPNFALRAAIRVRWHASLGASAGQLLAGARTAPQTMRLASRYAKQAARRNGVPDAAPLSAPAGVGGAERGSPRQRSSHGEPSPADATRFGASEELPERGAAGVVPPFPPCAPASVCAQLRSGAPHDARFVSW